MLLRIAYRIQKKKIKAHTVKTIVIDEADRLLEANSLGTVKNIIKSTLKERQLMAFSATIHEKTLETAQKLMKDPVVIVSENKEQVNPNINHLYFYVEQRDKTSLIRSLIANIQPQKAIVFINKSHQVEDVISQLEYHNFNACSIHGTTNRIQRKNTLEAFRNGKCKILN